MTAKDYTNLAQNLMGVIIQQDQLIEQMQTKIEELKTLLSQEEH